MHRSSPTHHLTQRSAEFKLLNDEWDAEDAARRKQREVKAPPSAAATAAAPAPNDVTAQRPDSGSASGQSGPSEGAGAPRFPCRDDVNTPPDDEPVAARSEDGQNHPDAEMQDAEGASPRSEPLEDEAGEGGGDDPERDSFEAGDEEGCDVEPQARVETLGPPTRKPSRSICTRVDSCDTQTDS